MGYIVGRSSAPVGGPEVASARKPEPKPLVVESPVREAPAKPPETPPAPAPSTGTAQQQPPPEPAKPEPVKPKPPEPERPAPSAKGDQPVPGEPYLQLVATAKAEAD